MQDQDNPDILKRRTRQQNKHTDHGNQNEMLEIMAKMVVCGDIGFSFFGNNG